MSVKVAIHKFSSCSGCQQSFLNAESSLPEIFQNVEIVHFIEGKRTNLAGPYDLSLVEGSVSTSDEIERIKEVRRVSSILVAMGACAVHGGPQALRNWSSIRQLEEASYPEPDNIDALDWNSGVDTYIPVDFKIYGCGPNPGQIVQSLASLLRGAPPALPQYSVCVECKKRGNTCLLVAGGLNCLGPVTVAGCGAACPSHRRGCYGCFGPMTAANSMALARVFERLGNSREEIIRAFRNQNSNAPAFREVASAYAQKRLAA